MMAKATVLFVSAIVLLMQAACSGSDEEVATPEARGNSVSDGSGSPSLLGIAPSLVQVRSALNLKLTREVGRDGDLSQLFEQADPRGLTESASISYAGDDGAVIVDLVRYGSADLATRAWEQTSGGSLGSTDVAARTLTFAQLGDRSAGRIFPPSDGNEFTTTVIVAQQGRIVFAVTVLSNDGDGLSRGAETLMRAIANEVAESRLGLAD